MKPSHTSPEQARTSLLRWPCSGIFRGPRHPRIVGPIARFTHYSSVRRRNRPKARCPDKASLMPASARPQSNPTGTCLSTRRNKVVGRAPRSRCMSVLASTVMRATPSTPIGVPTAMRGRRLAACGGYDPGYPRQTTWATLPGAVQPIRRSLVE